MFLVLLLLLVHFNFVAEVVNVKTAFLYREQDEEICMECPPGMKNIGMEDCIIFQEYIYDLV